MTQPSHSLAGGTGQASAGSAKRAPARYFFDCEFNEIDNGQSSEQGPFYNIDFISIGIVSEDGATYHGVNKDFDLKAAGDNKWLKDNVLNKLPEQSTWKSITEIRKDVLGFIKPDQEIELWARNNAYDVVSFCRLFGTMMSMRQTFNALGVKTVTFRDINEFRHDGDIDFSKLDVKDETRAHAADYDADFERLLYQQIMSIKSKKRLTL